MDWAFTKTSTVSRDVVPTKKVWERSHENYPFQSSFKLALLQNVKEVWDRGVQEPECRSRLRPES